MRAIRGIAAALALAVLMPSAALAVQPDEMLDDPVLEQRARDISDGLRCLVCRNESIDESNADLARDLRLLVRERLKAGDTDEEVVDFITDRYGEYVLLKPNAKGANLILWGAGPVLLLLGIGVAVVALRRRAGNAGTEALTEEEEARLREILKE